ncbi:Exosome complex protein [Rhodotorula toruloides]|uniref:Exosome complex protein n=2 Tax=Rhodotorula toruloides TaxID=5286 RepID=A0A2T0ABG2_RHOTO|nr:Exosome complex protein [Rhodotorula toruloides]PRQ75326.1 hypothetical protein AAT19DRAFT_14348 [Rhodotorula toruloides]
MADTDPSATLDTLSTSLDSLETALEPLLAKPFDEVLADQDPLVQARLQVLTSYMVHDLIWVYLKTAGIEPSTHPVMQEIERLKGYFGKLKSAEQGVSPDGPADRPRMQLDKSAASRFINAAISSSRAYVDQNYTDASAAAGPSGTHTRFTDEEQEEVERLLEDKDEDEDEEAEGAMDVGKAEHVSVDVEEAPDEASAKSKGKAKSVGEAKKRKGVDPFAGYDQPKLATPKAKSGTATPKSSETKRKRSQVESDAAASPASGTTTPSGELSKKQRKKLKMKQAKGEAK